MSTATGTMTNESGDGIAASAGSIDASDWNGFWTEDVAFMTSEHGKGGGGGASVAGPAAAAAKCSNDNKYWNAGTMPCPNALEGAFHSNDVVDLVGESNDVGNVMTSSEFDVLDGATNDGDALSSNAAIDLGGTPAAASPRFYSCVAPTEEELVVGSGYSASIASFDYEVHTASKADVEEILRTFETDLARGAASALGLADCPGSVGGVAVEVALRSSSGNGPPVRRTLRREAEDERTLQGDDAPIGGLSVDPADEVDTEKAGCTSTFAGPDSECSPVAGAMTAWISVANRQRQHLRQLGDADSHDEALLDAVRSYIENDSASYIKGDLLQVAYIGKGGVVVAQAEGAAPDADQAGGASQGGGSNVLLIVLAALAVAFAAATVLVAAALRRRRRRAQAAGENAPDLESGAFPALTPESQTQSNQWTQGTTEAPSPRSEGDDVVRGTNDLFGLDGMPRSDDALEGGGVRDVVPPSSLAALGAASTLARQASKSPPRTSPSSPASPAGSSDERDGASDRLDMAPTIQEANTSFDMAPFSPLTTDSRLADVSGATDESGALDDSGAMDDGGLVNDSGAVDGDADDYYDAEDREDDQSSTFEELDDEQGKENVRPLRHLIASPESSVPPTPIVQEDDDDEDEEGDADQNGVMV